MESAVVAGSSLGFDAGAFEGVADLAVDCVRIRDGVAAALAVKRVLEGVVGVGFDDIRVCGIRDMGMSSTIQERVDENYQDSRIDTFCLAAVGILIQR